MSRTALVRAAAVAVLILQWTTRSFGQPAELTPTALLRASDVVLAASVHGIATRAGRGTRSTFVSLEVEEVYKGWIPERQIVIKDSAAAPAFRIGESVLLFLEIDPGDRVLAPIESSGKWTVTSDPRTGERIARQDATSERTVPFGRVARAIPLASLRSAIPLSLLALVGMSRVSIDVSPRIAYTAASAAAVDATVPGPPRQLAVSVASSGNFAVVNLSWLPPTTGDVPASYRVDAGSAPGLSDIATVSVAATSLRATVASGFAAFSA